MQQETVAILGTALAVLAAAMAVRLALRRAAQRAQSAEHADVPGVIILPPLVYLGFLAAGMIAETLAPTPPWPLPDPARYAAGSLLVLPGVALAVLAAGRFHAAGTKVAPTLPATALVVGGPYRWSRNPIYVAMALVYAGLAIAAASLWTLAFLLPALLVIRYGVIAQEEAYLARKFGDAYRDYKARVRRWF